MSDDARGLPDAQADEDLPRGASPETGEPTDVDADDMRPAGAQRRDALPRHAGPQTDGPSRPRVRRRDTSVRGGVVGITAVIAATALLTLAGVLVALVVALLY